eukprot:scaffold17791_cov118-Amphora_coffeaeformis.AAC.2
MSFWLRLVCWLSLTVSIHAVDSDKHESCADWAMQGECESNPNFMLISCAKSCFQAQKAAAASAAEVAAVDSFFSLSAKDIDGTVVSFESLRGQVTVLTNVASYCGYTDSHYRSLVHLYAETAGKPVTILAFVSYRNAMDYLRPKERRNAPFLHILCHTQTCLTVAANVAINVIMNELYRQKDPQRFFILNPDAVVSEKANKNQERQTTLNNLPPPRECNFA